MELREDRQGGVLRLTVCDRALVKRPQWDEVLAAAGSGTALVALDLGPVEFVSSLFVEGCVRLKRLLAERGQALVLMALSAEHLRLLELVGGSGGLPVVKDAAELRARGARLAARAESPAPRGGVTSEEKDALRG